MTKAIAQYMTMPIPVGNLESYVHAVNNIPMLTAEEETALAIRLRDHNDLAAARRLVTSHLRFVVRVARDYAGYGLPLADLIQEGNIGLMKAVKRFDPEHKVRLVSFAVHWVRAEIHEFILRNWRIVKVATTKAQRKLFFNLRNAKKRLGWLNQKEVEAVAGDLGVSPKDVVEMESRLSGQDIGFDGPQSDDGDDADERLHAPAAYLQHLKADPAEQIECDDAQDFEQHRLSLALQNLDERSNAILQRRWLSDEKATLQELADEYQVSAERIRQLEQNALKKLKAQLAV